MSPQVRSRARPGGPAAAPLLLLAALSAALAPRPAAAGPAPAQAPGARTFTPWDQPPPAAPPASPELLALGERVFRGACVGCHGAKGEGDGREGKLIPIPPRDFVVAQFLCRHTPSGSLPRDEDLFRAVRRGFKSQVGMPSFAFLSDREVWAVIAFVKTLSTRWKEEEVPPPIAIPPQPGFSSEGAARGAALYKTVGCWKCHGEKGRGDGPSAATLKYDSELPVRPADFSRQADFKCGPRPADVFRTLVTGMDGTPMPSFLDNLSDAQRWDLVQFVLSVEKQAQAETAAARR
ncbi:MAG TPA: cytochrome c [Anaeromyxobacter sp.]|nr:cytochrome c [Anaeromyxobacter sp.]